MTILGILPPSGAQWLCKGHQVIGIKIQSLSAKFLPLLSEKRNFPMWLKVTYFRSVFFWYWNHFGVKLAVLPQNFGGFSMTRPSSPCWPRRVPRSGTPPTFPWLSCPWHSRSRTWDAHAVRKSWGNPWGNHGGFFFRGGSSSHLGERLRKRVKRRLRWV